MNLLFLDSINIETFGGYQNWISLVAPALAARGHRVVVAARPGSEFVRRLKEGVSGIEICEIKISGDFNPVTILKLKKLIAKDKIDIIICDFNKDVRLGGLAAKLDGKPRVVWRLGLNITKNNFVHRFLTPRLIDAAVVPSDDMKRKVVASGYIKESDVTVIPHGIPGRNFTRPNPEAAKNLRLKYNLSVGCTVAVVSGRFVEQKGHRYLIEAAVDVVKEFPDITFLLLGNGPLEETLRKRISELDLGDHFAFAGLLDDFDLELAGADVMVHPSIDEPFGFSVLEGMRAGLPVVASRVGGIPEFAIDGKTATLVEPGNPDLLSRGIISLLKSPDKMNAFGLAGQKRWREDFSLDLMTDRWENYLLKMADRNN